MTCFWRAKVRQIAAAQFITRAQQMLLAAEPALVFFDYCCAIAVNPDPNRIAPFAASSDVDCSGVAACRVLVQNLAQLALQSIRSVFPSDTAGLGRQQMAGGKGTERDQSHAQDVRGRAWRGPTLSAAAGGRPKNRSHSEGKRRTRAAFRYAVAGSAKIECKRTSGVDIKGGHGACYADRGQAAYCISSITFAVLRTFLLLSASSASMRVSWARLPSSSA